MDETRTGSTTSRGSSPRWARSDTAATVAAVASMPVFTARHGEIIEDGLDLLLHEGGLQGDDATHLGRVLCGHRGEGTGTVDVQRGKGLQVGLCAGAPARVGSGNGQRRGGCRVRHRATIGGHRGIVVL